MNSARWHDKNRFMFTGRRKVAITRRQALAGLGLGAAAATGAWLGLRRPGPAPFEGTPGANIVALPLPPIVRTLLANFFAGGTYDGGHTRRLSNVFEEYDALGEPDRVELGDFAEKIAERIRTIPDFKDLSRFHPVLERIRRGYLSREPDTELLAFSCLALAVASDGEGLVDPRPIQKLPTRENFEYAGGRVVEVYVWAAEIAAVYRSLPKWVRDEIDGGAVELPKEIAPLETLRAIDEFAFELVLDRTWKGAIPKLAIEECRRAAISAIELSEASKPLADARICDDLFEELALHRPESLVGLHFRLAHFPSTWRCNQGAIYRTSDSATRDYLIGLEGKTDDHDGLLKALAWIGDAVVAQQLRAWRDRPIWDERLNVSPAFYAHEAGWEVTEEGTRRDLCMPGGFELVPVKESDEPGERIECAAKTDWLCSRCQTVLQCLIDIDTAKAPFEKFGFQSPRFRVLTCASCWEATFAEWSVQGDLQLCNTKGPGVGRGDLFEPKSFAVRPLKTSINEYHSALGGYPKWLQDVEYPDCPRCHKTMVFLAQIDLGEIGGDGTIYAFACDPCRTTAATSQCT